MNRVLFIFSFVLFLVSNSLYASNLYTDIDLSKQEIAWLNKTPEIKIGIQITWIPLRYVKKVKNLMV